MLCHKPTILHEVKCFALDIKFKSFTEGILLNYTNKYSKICLRCQPWGTAENCQLNWIPLYNKK